MNFKGYKYRIYPNQKQTRQLAQMFGNVRWVYNWSLARKIEAYQKESNTMSAFTLMTELLAEPLTTETILLRRIF